MQNPLRNWRLYRLAKACNCRPSDLLDVQNSYAAFCLDEAVIHFGDTLESELDKAAEKAKSSKAAEGKQRLILERWLTPTPKDGKPPAGHFANPVPTK